MLLDRRTIFVKERVAVFKIRDTYDLLDPESGATVGIVKEETTGWARWLRLLLKKSYLPSRVNVYEREDIPPVITLRKRPGFPHTTVAGRTWDRSRASCSPGEAGSACTTRRGSRSAR